MGLAVLAGLVGWPLWRALQRRRLQQRPFPAEWRRLLRARFPLTRRLPPPLLRRLQGLVQVFVAEVPVLGCNGLVVTDAMRVLVAAQACVLLLGRGPKAGERPYPNLHRVLLYPGPFVVDTEQPGPGGVVQTGRDVRLGESWQQGQVVLSWPDAQAGANGSTHNVVWHEFAHQLDQDNGHANGGPALAPGQSPEEWARVLSQAYDDLRWLADAGEPTLLDPYGASAPEEFFAVATETFFLNPQDLAQQHPALYRELSRFYALDPRAW